MRKRLSTSLFFAIMLSFAAESRAQRYEYTLADQQVGFYYSNLIAKPVFADILTVPIEVRQRVLDRLRRSAFGSNSDKAMAVLLVIADEDATQKILSKYTRERRGYESDALVISGQARFVALFAEDFMRNDAEKYDYHFDSSGGPEYPVEPLSVYAALAALKLLSNCPEVSPEVRAWASGFHDQRTAYWAGIKSFRGMMQEWWTINQQHFATKNYAAVQPGRTIDTSYWRGADGINPPPKTAATAVTATVATTAVAATPTLEPPPSQPAAVPPQPGSSQRKELALAIAALVTAATLVFWRLMKHR